MKKEVKYNISNMHCSNCSMFIEKHFNKQKGIKVNVLLADNLGTFTFDDAFWNEVKIKKELKKIGYPIKKENDFNYDLFSLIGCFILLTPFIIHMLLMFLKKEDLFSFFNSYIQLILATIIILLGGFKFLKGMFFDFKNKHLGMDVLVSLGILVSYFYSLILLIFKISGTLYFETTSMLISFISLGKYIEKKAKKKTSSALNELMSLKQTSAKVINQDDIKEIPIDKIKVDDKVIVAQGSNIPLDGIIIQGDALVDESMLTGESILKNKNVNDLVYEGNILVKGNIIIKVTNDSSSTYLSSIIKKVNEIQASKPKIAKIADKIAGVFVPVILGISILSFSINLLINKDFSVAINRAIATLMISCPCSFGLATPLAILVGSSKAIKEGIIYNNTDIFEKACKIDTICFDKTGTLSQGILEVKEASFKNKEALDILYSMELTSIHPIAKAIIKYGKENKAKYLNIKVNETTGVGLSYDDYLVYKENNDVILKRKDEIIAKVTLIDSLKKEAKDVIDHLLKKKIDVFLISGDNKEISLKVASALNIDLNNVYYQVLPLKKGDIINNLKNKKNVCFVGDGINDSLALNAANLSIAMGSGSDIAKSSADITLSNNNLYSILKALKLSKAVYHDIIMNFIYAFSYNLIAIPLAFLGKIPPMLAGIFMAFSSLLVVLNSLRLYLIKL